MHSGQVQLLVLMSVTFWFLSPREQFGGVSQWWSLSFSGGWSRIIHLGYVGSSKPASKLCETLSQCGECKGGRAVCRDNSVVDWGPGINPQCWGRKKRQGAHNRCAFSARTRSLHCAVLWRDICACLSTSIEEFFINFQKFSSLNDMSVFACFLQISKHAKKQTNKHLWLSSSSPHDPPHAAGPFPQERTSSFQPLMSEMNKTLGDTMESWKDEITGPSVWIWLWGWPGKVLTKRAESVNLTACWRTRSFILLVGSNWTQPNQFGSLFHCKMGISTQEINGDRQLFSSLTLRGTPKEHRQGVIYQKFSLIEILFKMCGQVLWKHRYFWRSFFLNLEKWV